MIKRPGLSVDMALSDINDSVRYTVEASAGSYSTVVDSVTADLKSSGMELVRSKNTWMLDGYKGINTTWRDPGTGKLFELQFHTPESFLAKTASHGIYERLRLPGISPAERASLTDENYRVFRIWRFQRVPWTSSLVGGEVVNLGEQAFETDAMPGVRGVEELCLSRIDQSGSH